jgi:hypothetical protein
MVNSDSASNPAAADAGSNNASCLTTKRRSGYNGGMSESPKSGWFQFGIFELFLLTAILAVVWGLSASFPIGITLARDHNADQTEAASGSAGPVSIPPTPPVIAVRGAVGSVIVIAAWAAVRRCGPES